MLQDSINIIASKQDIQETLISQDLLDLETNNTDLLAPISSLKSSEPEIYWFIVSWLETAYKTPKWKGYYSEEWMRKTKIRGIDCSGFSRVMLDQIFNKKIKGGSQGILNRYCKPIALSQAKMGDLVFFRAPFSKTDKIVHVGVYLQNNYFVHATSQRSAAKGLGLSVNSIKEKNWAKELVTLGRVKPI